MQIPGMRFCFLPWAAPIPVMPLGHPNFRMADHAGVEKLSIEGYSAMATHCLEAILLDPETDSTDEQIDESRRGACRTESVAGLRNSSPGRANGSVRLNATGRIVFHQVSDG